MFDSLCSDRLQLEASGAQLNLHLLHVTLMGDRPLPESSVHLCWVLTETTNDDKHNRANRVGGSQGVPGWAADWCHLWLRALTWRNRFQAMGAAASSECQLQHSDRLIYNQRYWNSSERLFVKEALTVKRTLSCSEVQDGKQLALDLCGEFKQLTTSVQILVTRNHLQSWIFVDILINK